jgi:hypothetical protein
VSLYNFKKETKLYLVYNDNQYRIDISDISFSQTFTEHSYVVKTLQEPLNMFEGSVINKANPANFEFSIPALQEADLSIVVDLLLNYNSDNTLDTFDLYAATQKDIFKLETCVPTSGSFNIEKQKVLSLDISGEASKLTRVGDFGTFVIPGTPIARSATTRYNIVRNLSITLNAVLLDNIYKTYSEIKGRKNSKTRFLEELMLNLQQKIHKEDEF